MSSKESRERAYDSIESIKRRMGYTTTPVPGADRYYVITNTVFRGIYTDWGKIGDFALSATVVYRRCATWKEALDALSGPSLAEIQAVLNEHDIDIMTGPRSDHDDNTSLNASTVSHQHVNSILDHLPIPGSGPDHRSFTGRRRAASHHAAESSATSPLSRVRVAAMSASPRSTPATTQPITASPRPTAVFPQVVSSQRSTTSQPVVPPHSQFLPLRSPPSISVRPALDEASSLNNKDADELPRGSRPKRGWSYYAVLRGWTTGIIESSDEFTRSIQGYPCSEGRGFRHWTQARNWLVENGYDGEL